MTPRHRISILIADDHFIVRSGLVAVIQSEPDLLVVAQASDGAQAEPQAASRVLRASTRATANSASVR